MIYKNVLIIGPDLKSTYNKVKDLYDGVDNCIIGDGSRWITEEDILSLAGKIDSNTKIIVNAHGALAEHPVYEDFDISIYKDVYKEDTEYKAIEKLWGALKKASGDQPLQINLLTCHAGAANESIKYLPVGSVLIMHAKKDESGWGDNSRAIIKSKIQDESSNPLQAFLNNISNNLSNGGASIAVNLPGSPEKTFFIKEKEGDGVISITVKLPVFFKEKSFSIKAKDFDCTPLQYFNSVSHEVLDFYAKTKPILDACSIFYTKTSVANFFQQDGLQQPIISEEEAAEFFKYIMLIKIRGNTPEEKLIKILNKDGVDLNGKNEDNGNCLLHEAVKKDLIEIAKILINKGLDVNIKNHEGITPLHAAVESGNFEMVELLLDKGADPNTKDKYDCTPLYRAVYGKKLLVIKKLVEGGADMNILGESGLSPLCYSIKNSCDDIAEFLIESGADVNLRNNDGFTPLHYAVGRGDDKMIELLMENGAEINMKGGKYGKTPLHCAVESGNAKIVKLLLKKGANMFSQDNDGYTPIQCSAKKGDSEITKIFLDHGADGKGGWIDWLFGYTPQQLAEYYGHKEIADYIANHQLVEEMQQDQSI